MATLDDYIKNFRRLRTDKDRKRWSALTAYQAPHKPFVLLSEMDLVAEGVITENVIEPSLELLETFNRYWAVGWDFQNDTFMQGWVAFRTRKECKLTLTSDPHTYEKPGRYRILVKVIDIFGNDTSQAFHAEVA